MKTRLKKRISSPKPNLSALDLLVSLDTEATGLDLRHGCKPFLISSCTPQGVSRCWEWRVDPITRKPHIPPQDKREVAAYFKNKIIVFHNAKFDLRALSEIGFKIYFSDDDWLVHASGWLQGKRKIAFRIDAKSYHDTQGMAHACSSGDDYQRLKSLAVRHLRFPDSDEKELKQAVALTTRYCKAHEIKVTLGHGLKIVKATGKPERETNYDYWIPRFVYDWIKRNEGKVPKELQHLKDICLTYARKDAERTILLCLFYFDLMKELGVTNQYDKERQLLKTVYRIETDGITYNKRRAVKKMKELAIPLRKHADTAIKYGSKHLGRTINLGSYKDMQELLYKKLKLPEQKKPGKNKEGDRVEAVTTDKKALEELLEATSRKKSPNYSPGASRFLKDVIISRSYQKGIEALQGYSYQAVSLPGISSPDIVVLYPSLNQWGTDTTRFASSRPNGQNVSKIAIIEVAGLELPGPRIRDVFCPPPGWIWYSSDYNQLELRVFAVLSDEKSLIEALRKGYDFHGYVATKIFKVAYDKVTAAQRRIAKNTVFAIIFGGSPWKVDLTAGMSGAYDQFAGLFPNVTEYMREMVSRARKDRYVLTADGYRLDIPHNEPYKIVSYKVQGTAGRIIKNAMTKIDSCRLVDWKDSRIVLQVHDELINGFRKDSDHHCPARIHAINSAMEEAGKEMGIDTPVSCERISSDWGHGEKVIVTRSSIKKAA